MKLNYIIFYFGNGDCATVDGKYVGRFLVDETRHIINRTTVDSIDVMDVAHQFMIEITKEANVDFVEFGDKENEPIKLFDRFKENDIAAIDFELVGEDGQAVQYDFYLSWNKADEYTNTNQETLTSQFGHLYIVVDDTKDKSIHFKQSEIDQKGTNQQLGEMIRANKA